MTKHDCNAPFGLTTSNIGSSSHVLNAHVVPFFQLDSLFVWVHLLKRYSAALL